MTATEQDTQQLSRTPTSLAHRYNSGSQMRWAPSVEDADVPPWSWLVPGLDDGTATT